MKKLYVLLALFIGGGFLPMCANAASSDCDQTFYGLMRQGKQYTFKDDFSAGSSDKWLRNKKVEYWEQYDYNNSSDFPVFNWTDELKNNDYKVGKNQTMTVIRADRPYQIYSIPVSRSYDNFLIKYTLTYSTDVAGNDRYTHTECKYYEISRCGDGIIDSDYSEECDPGDASKTGWGNGGCSSSCKPINVDQPVCNSSYNGQRLTSLTEGSYLCVKGTYSEFKYNENTHKWTWKCSNVAGDSVDCWAIKPYCGDGIKDSGEACDYNDPNHEGWGNGGCDNSCKPITVSGPSCNSNYNGQRLTNLTEGPHLCTEGTYSDFHYDENTHKWTWKCNNTLGQSTDCSAIKPYCGDGIKDSGEACDYNDPNHVGWSELGCDNSCQPISAPSGCDETFYDKLRYGHQYTFYDDFSAGSSNKWLRRWVMEYQEQYDYNKSPDFPAFAWTTNLVNNNYMVAANTTMRVLQATSPYPILAVPAQRAYNNLFIKYTIVYSSDSAGTNKVAHSECAYYEITRCGDGIIDSDYGEECDPGSAGTSVLPDGRICNAECKIEDAPSHGSLVIEKTLISDSRYVTEVGQELEWEIKVTAVGGDLHNVVITDNLPEVLSYVSYIQKIMPSGVTMNPNQPTINGKTLQWKTTGTLKEGKSIVLEVTTRVDEMPKPTDNYKNVACARSDENPEECDDEPVEPSNGILRIEKTLKDKIAVEYTGQVLKWEVKVWAEGGDVTDFEVQDLLPKALDYVSYRVVSNVDGLRVTGPTGPVSSGNNNIYTWDVEGTLREGHELIIEVETKVNKMPKSDNEYRNIACVIKDDNKDCDDDEPDEPTDGTLKVEKTLIGSKEIKNTGDAVVWNLKVTAVGGDVKNPIITDTLPRVLGYSGYMVIHNPGLMIHTPTVSTVASGGRFLDEIKRTTEGILEKGNYIEIQLTTYAKVMPDKDYKNVLCARPEDNPDQEDCDDEPVPAPDLWIKKSFTDGSKTKTVKVGDEIAYKITFGNSGNASATITSIKDFLPKNVEYITGAIFLDGQSNHENTTGNEIIGIIRGEHDSRVVDGVYIDIYTGITLKPGESGYIILTGRVLSGNQDKRTNFACIYLNGEKVDCDDATHELGVQMCEKLDVPSGDLSSGGGSKEVKCSALSGVVAEYIEIDCGDGVSGNRYITGSNINSLTGTCTYPSGEKTYSLVCKVKVDGTEYFSDSCRGSVRVPGNGGGGCFPAGTKVTMADGLQKNIEDVEKGDIVLSYNVGTNTTEANVVKQRIVHFDLSHEMYELTIDGNVLRVTDVHPFYVKKSDSIKDYAWVEAQNLKVGDILLMSDGRLVKIENISHYSNKETVYNLEVDGNHDYFVDKGYLVHNKGGGGTSSCFIAGTKVTMADGSQKNIEDVEIGEKLLGANGTVNTVLGFHRPLLGEKELWSINGGKYFVTAEHPFMTTEGWKSLNPELTKIGMENLPVGLLKVGDILITEEGNVEIYSLDAKKSSEDTQLYNFKLDGDHTYYADNYLVHNKGGSGTPTCQSVTVKNGDVTCSASSDAYFKLQCGNKTYYSYDYRDGEKKVKSYTFEGVKCTNNNYKCSISKYDDEDGPRTSNSKCIGKEVPEGYEQCFNVNAGNFSIEEGEIFPFFWNMHNLEVWIDENKENYDWYTEIRGTAESYKRATENLNDYAGKSCEAVGTIAKDSMVCTFKIYGGGEKTTTPLYTIEGPCLSKENLLKETGLIGARYSTMKRTYCGSDKCYFSFDPNRDDSRALLPSAVYYIQNFGSNATVSLDVGGGIWNLEGNINGENNKSYGEYKIVLDNVKYLQCMGDEENSVWTEVTPKDYFTPCQNNFVLTDSYTVQKTPSGNLTASTEKLSKYKYLKGAAVFSDLLNAVQTTEYTPNAKVNEAMKTFADKYSKLAVSVNVGNSFLQGTNTDIKKVPGKSIYFVDGDITIKGGNKNIDKPFTIVQIGGNTTIEGDVKHNMMLLTNGDIKFKGNGCDKDQIVKGIFYAGKNLSRGERYRNIEINSNTWCTKGGLHVQGVLIGNDFNSLMDDSRSHLNDWFNVEDKKNSVMNGASVLIEYSPSIFTKSTMPPGAEDFTTALSIYKN